MSDKESRINKILKLIGATTKEIIDNIEDTIDKNILTISLDISNAEGQSKAKKVLNILRQ